MGKCSVLMVALLLHSLLHSAAGKTFDVRPLASHVRLLQQDGHTVAFWGDYHGQLGFTGRLLRPVPELLGATAGPDLQQLALREPGAYVLLEGRGVPPTGAVEVAPYRRKWWALLPVNIAATTLPLAAQPPPVADSGVEP